MEKGKWFVRIASLALLMGFFMPAVLVSCSGGFIETSQSFSLANIAGQLDQSILYLLPIGAIIAAILSILRVKTISQQAGYIWGQLGAMAIGLITMAASLLSINDQVSRGTYGLVKVTPAIGAFIIIGGIIGFGIGWAMQKQAMGDLQVGAGHVPKEYEFRPPDQQGNLPQSPLNFQGAWRLPETGPYLELISGDLPIRTIPLPGDFFAIGRGSDSHLQLPDRTVSRTHALIRQAQGMWFLQDQQSSGGTFVNGSLTPATRLQNGDEIAIGPYRFIFHSG